MQLATLVEPLVEFRRFDPRHGSVAEGIDVPLHDLVESWIEPPNAANRQGLIAFNTSIAT